MKKKNNYEMNFFGKTFGASYSYPYLCTIKNKQTV